jgi:hypothetical protein
MSLLFVILGLVGAFLVVILKALAVDQVRGQIQRRITASVDAAIASLPDELQAEYAEDWRAELAAAISMPVTAARLARGLRQSAIELAGEPALAPAGARRQTPAFLGAHAVVLTVSGVLAIVAVAGALFGVLVATFVGLFALCVLAVRAVLIARARRTEAQVDFFFFSGQGRLGRTMGMAGLCALVPLVGNLITTLLTGPTGWASLLVLPVVVGVVVATVTAALDPGVRPG